MAKGPIWPSSSCFGPSLTFPKFCFLCSVSQSAKLHFTPRPFSWLLFLIICFNRFKATFQTAKISIPLLWSCRTDGRPKPRSQLQFRAMHPSAILCLLHCSFNTKNVCFLTILSLVHWFYSIFPRCQICGCSPNLPSASSIFLQKVYRRSCFRFLTLSFLDACRLAAEFWTRS